MNLLILLFAEQFPIDFLLFLSDLGKQKPKVLQTNQHNQAMQRTTSLRGYQHKIFSELILPYAGYL